MSKERILPYKMAKKISQEELQEISAAGWTGAITAHVCYNPQTGTWDDGVDPRADY